MLKKITNLSKFTPKGALGELFKKARELNRLNKQLSSQLPEQFASLSLCAVKDGTAIFVSNNQAVVFRAQQQHNTILRAIQQIKALEKIEKVVVKLSLKRH